MKKISLLVLFAITFAVVAYSAPQEKESEVTVVYVNGDTIKLKSIEIGTEEDGMLGKSFKRLRRMPVMVGNILLEVPMENLSKIEITGIDKDGAAIGVRLTSKDGKTIEGVTSSESKLIWRGIHPFADAQATLEPSMIKEILIK